MDKARKGANEGHQQGWNDISYRRKQTTEVRLYLAIHPCAGPAGRFRKHGVQGSDTTGPGLCRARKENADKITLLQSSPQRFSSALKNTHASAQTGGGATRRDQDRVGNDSIWTFEHGTPHGQELRSSQYHDSGGDRFST